MSDTAGDTATCEGLAGDDEVGEEARVKVAVDDPTGYVDEEAADDELPDDTIEATDEQEATP